MFCPNCGTEYRDGFTICSDCGATLVAQLASDDGDPDAMETLWTGLDASVKESVCRKLDAGGISHEDDSIESRFLPAFPQDIYRIQIRAKDHEAALHAMGDLSPDDLDVLRSPGSLANRNSYWLRSAIKDRPALDRLLRPGSPQDESKADALSGLSAASEGDPNAELSALEGDEQGAPDDVIQHFDPDNATSQVWSGPDLEMAQSIFVCLREVGIGSAIDESNGSFCVRVMPDAEARAKEIVREIIEQTPPA